MEKAGENWPALYWARLGMYWARPKVYWARLEVYWIRLGSYRVRLASYSENGNHGLLGMITILTPLLGVIMIIILTGPGISGL